MNNIDILELLAKKIEEQTSIIASCSSIINKKAEARERTEYIKIKEFVETLIAQNKELKEKIKEINEEYNAEQKHEMENTIPKSKVKEKIKEVDIQLQKLKDELTGRKTNFVNKNMLFAKKEVLQSLLGKE